MHCHFRTFAFYTRPRSKPVADRDSLSVVQLSPLTLSNRLHYTAIAAVGVFQHLLLYIAPLPHACYFARSARYDETTTTLSSTRKLYCTLRWRRVICNCLRREQLVTVKRDFIDEKVSAQVTTGNCCMPALNDWRGPRFTHSMHRSSYTHVRFMR